MDARTRRYALVVPLGLVGMAALLNPLYLELLLPYPTQSDGFDLTSLYYAAFATLGVLLLAVTGHLLVSRDRLTARRAMGLAALSVLGVVVFTRVWNGMLVDLLGLEGAIPRRYLTPSVGYPGGETIFVESALAFLFPVGVAAGTGDLRGLLLGLGGIAGALVIDVVLTFPIGYVGLFGLVLLLGSSDLLGVPFLGAVIAACFPLSGFALSVRSGSPRSDDGGGAS